MALMPDQAAVLRELMERHVVSEAGDYPSSETAGCRVWTIASGKGGVGKSLLALNLAIALAQRGHTVCLLDAQPGGGHHDLLCGLNSEWTLADFQSGYRTLSEVVLTGPAGIHLLSGATELLELPCSNEDVPSQTWWEFSEFLDQHTFVIMDAPTGNQKLTRELIRISDRCHLVTTPELTSVAECYSLIKTLSVEDTYPDLEVLINQATSEAGAVAIADRLRQTTHTFLQRELGAVGFIPYDTAVSQSVGLQQPFLVCDSDSPASQHVIRLAESGMKEDLERPRKWSERFQSLVPSVS